jgi:hypothetical protein
MTTETTGLFQGLAPLLVNRTVIMTVAADGKGLRNFEAAFREERGEREEGKGEGGGTSTPLFVDSSMV